MNEYSMQSQHVIVAAAFGYEPEHVRVFLRSAHEAGVDAQIVLLRARRSRSFETVVCEYNPRVRVWIPAFVRLHEFGRRYAARGPMQSVWPYLFARLLGDGDGGSFAATRMVPFCLRYFYARHFYTYDFLRRHNDHFDKVMLSDVRDVVFEGDPFDYVAEGIVTGTEAHRIIDSSWNAGHLLQTYRNQEALGLLHKKVICAGVTIGSMDGILEYLSTMTGEVLSNLCNVAMRLADQEMHNYILWTGMLETPVQICENGHGPIATIGVCTEEELDALNLTPDRYASASDLPAVIHQYDRHPTLAEKITAKYS